MRDILAQHARRRRSALLDREAPDAVLERFVPHDPDAAGCEIEVANLPAAA